MNIRLSGGLSTLIEDNNILQDMFSVQFEGKNFKNSFSPTEMVTAVVVFNVSIFSHQYLGTVTNAMLSHDQMPWSHPGLFL